MKGDPSPTWLRLRLFALLTAGKRNGTGVYAEIFVSLILHFFVFNLLIFFCEFSYFFCTFFFIPIPFTRRDFYFIKLIFYNFFLSIYFIFFFYTIFLPTTFTHTRDSQPLDTHYPRHLATLINIWLLSESDSKSVDITWTKIRNKSCSSKRSFEGVLREGCASCCLQHSRYFSPDPPLLPRCFTTKVTATQGTRRVAIIHFSRARKPRPWLFRISQKPYPIIVYK